LEISSALNRSYLDSRSLQMQIYREQGDWPKLRATAEDFLRLVPGDPSASGQLQAANTGGPTPKRADRTPEDFLNLSMSQYQAGRYAEAIDSAKKALALRPGYAEAYNNLAAAYASSKQWDEAIRAAREAVRLKPDFQLAKNNLAWAENEKTAANRLLANKH